MTQCSRCGTALDAEGVCTRCSDRSSRNTGDEQQTGKRGQRHPTAGHRRPLLTGIKLLCGLLVLSGLGSLAIGTTVRSMSQTAAASPTSARK
mgnify:CR=1 FL=1|jgi:hypothetical protein